MTIDELLKLETQCRRADKWLVVAEEVTAEDGTPVQVRLKSSGFYNQIFTVNGSVDYASGHTINKVAAMHKHIRDTINNHRLAHMPRQVAGHSNYQGPT